ncbi:MAG TPA: hypothetical protein VFO76_02305 [Candidatus Kapabacteria bacterium]|nr:hypothetical protein [Candidatus Kapabacteria bacterium]
MRVSRLPFSGIFVFLVICCHYSSASQIRPDWPFHDQLIAEMESPKDTIYVADRSQLIKIGKPQVRGRSVAFSNSEFGVLIYLRNSAFKAKRHSIDREHHGVDGIRAHGIDSTMPSRQLTDIKILWDTTVLSIPLRAFVGLYDLNFSTAEAYLTIDGAFLYIYITGSDGAGKYSVKFVFNHERYVTRLFGSVTCMNQYDYIDGHGNCE